MLDLLFPPKTKSLSRSVDMERGPSDDFWFQAIGRPSASGVNVTLDSAMKLSACWSATRLLCGTSAGLPIKLYQRNRNGTRSFLADHRSYLSLMSPNQETNSFLFRTSLMNHQVNAGNGYAEIERTIGGQVVALHPIHSSRVTVGRNAQKQLTYYVRSNDGSQSPLPSADVLHWRSAMSVDGVTGMGVIAYGRESIGRGIATTEYGAAFFGNDATPGIILKHPGKLDKPARENLRKEWDTMHQGSGNAHKLGVLWEGMTVEKLPFTQKDSQFIETEQLTIEDIARFYTVPPHMIQHLLRATNNNIEAQGIDFVKYSLLPWLLLQEAELNAKLLTEKDRKEGLYFKIIVEGLLRGDSAARAAFYKAMFELGVFCTNDILELEDRDGIGDDGDKRFVSTNLISLERAGEEPVTAPAATAVAPGDASSQQPENSDTEDATDETLAKLTATVNSLQSLVATRLEALETLCKSTSLHSMQTQVAARMLADQQRELAATSETLAKTILRDVFSRMLSVEINNVKRVAEKSSRFTERLSEFYTKHSLAMAKNLAGPLAAVCDNANVETVIAEHVAESQRQLDGLLDCKAEELAAKVDECVSKWHERTINLEG